MCDVALRVCLDCTARFAVGAPWCPHCGSERHVEQHEAEALGVQEGGVIEEDSMPKISRHGGASIADEATDVQDGEGVSAGTDSSTSSGKASTSPEPSEKQGRSRARKTASRSGRARTDSSTAPTTDGGPEAGTSATDSADA
ncbi:hypothetical protein Srubr_02760 [Streptomyces rubradiris]|uniref:C2H2-type domain-containing protein n=1 Tax=Streptomyces rubradiris TaxID=285531 RepID=A0ABQ3R3L3_STRRR|nr:hypothetical protein GCM10018792_76490 [Streptomyces rubradiris]GHI50430.1 hypothetical protein Srubr_02760 [Streptomyces rubradiris]